MDQRTLTAAMMWTACALALSCSDPVPPPVTADAAPAPAQQGHIQRDGDGGQGTPVEVDRAIMDACGLPTPHFDFDSADVGAQAKNSLDALAACFTTGPLKGKRLNLVGHADLRGELHYNFALGQQRAGQIAAYLAGAGLPERRLSTSSRGELEARGTDEAGWARDRRVEILLAQ